MGCRNNGPSEQWAVRIMTWPRFSGVIAICQSIQISFFVLFRIGKLTDVNNGSWHANRCFLSITSFSKIDIRQRLIINIGIHEMHFILTFEAFLAHLAKGNVSFFHHLTSVVRRLLTFHILIFSSKMKWNLVGTIYGRSFLNIAQFVPIH